MKKHLYMIGAVCMTLFLASCGGEKTDETAGDEPKETCFYKLDTGSYELTWTAYKTSDRVGVGGTFNEINMTVPEAETQEDAIKGIEFEINTASVESQNEERNGKIAEHFFGTISTPTITGKVESVDLEKNKATVLITMNRVEFPVEGSLTMDGDSFEFSATINAKAWNAEPGVEALNEECHDLHTGNDGVSILWPDFTVGFKGTLNKNCE